MARPLSPQKRTALLNAAVATLAQAGLSATTATIAKKAGVAVGTLFTYFPTKEQLLNEVYLMLKEDMAAVFLPDYPHNAECRDQMWHIWCCYIEWGLRNPEGKRVLRILAVSDILTPETVARKQQDFKMATQMFDDGIARSLFATDSKEFIYAIIQNMSDATSEQIERRPDEQQQLIQLGFNMMWNAISS